MLTSSCVSSSEWGGWRRRVCGLLLMLSLLPPVRCENWSYCQSISRSSWIQKHISTYFVSFTLSFLQGASYSSIPRNMLRGKGQLFRAQHFIKPIVRGYHIVARVELASLLLEPPQVAALFARLGVINFSPFQLFPRALPTIQPGVVGCKSLAVRRTPKPHSGI